MRMLAARSLDDWLMLVYYAATIVVGVLTVAGDPSPNLVAQLGPGVGLYAFGAGYAVLGVLAGISRWLRARCAEMRALLGLAGFAGFHGVLLILDGAYVSGIRLAAAPLMMVAFARRLHGVTLTRDDVRRMSDG